jgi:hypothetical protein
VARSKAELVRDRVAAADFNGDAIGFNRIAGSALLEQLAQDRNA